METGRQRKQCQWRLGNNEDSDTEDRLTMKTTTKTREWQRRKCHGTEGWSPQSHTAVKTYRLITYKQFAAQNTGSTTRHNTTRHNTTQRSCTEINELRVVATCTSWQQIGDRWYRITSWWTEGTIHSCRGQRQWTNSPCTYGKLSNRLLLMALEEEESYSEYVVILANSPAPY